MSDQNVCEHGDHPAPEGKRFCSPECARCEHESTNEETGCDGICLERKTKGGEAMSQQNDGEAKVIEWTGPDGFRMRLRVFLAAAGNKGELATAETLRAAGYVPAAELEAVRLELDKERQGYERAQGEARFELESTEQKLKQAQQEHVKVIADLSYQLGKSQGEAEGLRLTTVPREEHHRVVAEMRERSLAELGEVDARRHEGRQLLRRLVKYVREDRAETPGVTRLARLTDQVDDYLQRTSDPRDILRSAAPTDTTGDQPAPGVVDDGRPPGAHEVRVFLSEDGSTLSFPRGQFTTVRACRHCGALITGGPTACVHCMAPPEKGGQANGG